MLEDTKYVLTYLGINSKLDKDGLYVEYHGPNRKMFKYQWYILMG